MAAASPFQQVRSIYRNVRGIPRVYRRLQRDIRIEVDRVDKVTRPIRTFYAWKGLIPKRRPEPNWLLGLPPVYVMNNFCRAVKLLVKQLGLVRRELRIAYYGFKPGLLALKYIAAAVKDTTLIITTLRKENEVQRLTRAMISSCKLLTAFTFFVLLIRRLSWRGYINGVRLRKSAKAHYKVCKILNRPRQLLKTIKKIILRQPRSTTNLFPPEKKKPRPYVWDLLNKEPVSGKPITVHSYSYKCRIINGTMYMSKESGSSYKKPIELKPIQKHRFFRSRGIDPLKLERIICNIIEENKKAKTKKK